MNSYDHILDYEDANGIYAFVENATDDELTQAVQYYDDAYRRYKEVADNKLTILETLLDGIVRSSKDLLPSKDLLHGKFTTTAKPQMTVRDFHDEPWICDKPSSKDLLWLDADDAPIP